MLRDETLDIKIANKNYLTLTENALPDSTTVANRYRMWPSCSSTTKYGLSSLFAILVLGILVYLHTQKSITHSSHITDPILTALALFTGFAGLFCCAKICEHACDPRELPEAQEAKSMAP